MSHPPIDAKEQRRLSAILASGLIAAGKTTDKDVAEAFRLYQKVGAYFSDAIEEDRQKRRAERGDTGRLPDSTDEGYDPHRY